MNYSKILSHILSPHTSRARPGPCRPTGKEPAAGANFYRDLVGVFLIGAYLIGTNIIGYITYIGDPANLQ